MFTNDEEYEWVKQSGVFNLKTLSRLYSTKPEDVQTCMFFDPAKAFKFTIPLPRMQG